MVPVPGPFAARAPDPALGHSRTPPARLLQPKTEGFLCCSASILAPLMCFLPSERRSGGARPGFRSRRCPGHAARSQSGGKLLRPAANSRRWIEGRRGCGTLAALPSSPRYCRLPPRCVRRAGRLFDRCAHRKRRPIPFRGLFGIRLLSMSNEMISITSEMLSVSLRGLGASAACGRDTAAPGLYRPGGVC